ncbi:MAG: hypothetical protein RLZ44_182, partial [Pseudomonadota bacterium]
MSRPLLQSIRLQILLVALIPASLLALLLSSFAIGSRSVDLMRAFEERSQAVAVQVATAAVHRLDAGDRDGLRLLCRQTLTRNPSVERVRIVDANGEVQADELRQQPPQPHWLRFEALIASTQAPDLAANLALPSVPAQAAAPAKLGRVELFASDRDVRSTRWPIVRNTMLLTLAGLLLATLFAVTVSARIARPARRLAEALGRVRGGDLQVRIPEQSSGEFGALERGFNAMTEELASSNIRFQQQV